jgi:hypothetical protein
MKETAKAVLHLLNFQSAGKPRSMSLMSQCAYLRFC